MLNNLEVVINNEVVFSLSPLSAYLRGMFFLSNFITVVVLVLAYLFRRQFFKIRKVESYPVQYLPPKNMSVFMASKIFAANEIISAIPNTPQILDFIVRGYFDIYEGTELNVYGDRKYTLKLKKDIDDLLPEEKEFLRDISGKDSLVIGDVIEFHDRSSCYFWQN